ncbi:serine/threonine protein phosphatase [Chromobacterium phragmitis]|uniref:Phosphatase PAP2/dual specificity phosphatase family protein n=1 Tax=Chromobacterium phragmitis TaxID=2202141 RepID=A0A344ULY3_9NEIS|nr:phosphatase PAP2/dual specificity phosphatase family protein [Chromobacterium phragmitis]AXE30885.1 serine/threonine protein phosphatase [Chromobacterium phragmitis]AXE36281.1 serine/threonine protein phosphatase [Chromobacterium phragmitis]
MSVAGERRPWRLACLWLLILGPGFFLLYGAANEYAASLPPERVGNLAMAWERHIPLWPWTIAPYWSIDLLYGLSLFLCASRRELNVHAMRLLAVTALSCLCFVLFPLRFGFDRPPLDGVFGQLFQLLMGFDKPFNQAPSLHIGLLTVLWLRYWQHVPPRWRWLLHGWFALIGVSVLTTWQHHFWDVPSGFALAVLVCYALPMEAGGRRRAQARRRSHRLAARYGLAAAACLAGAWTAGGWGWLLYWPAASLALPALGYLGLGPSVMQKQGGCRRFSARVLLWPYSLAAGLCHRYFLRSLPGAEEIAPGVWLGPISAAEEKRFAAVLDLAAEYDRRAHVHAAYESVPLLDLLLPCVDDLSRAVHALERLRVEAPGPLLVHCALGLTRSATVALAWLVASGRAASLAEARALLSQRRQRVELSESQYAQLAELCAKLEPL